jgi:hypothetical protein
MINFGSILITFTFLRGVNMEPMNSNYANNVEPVNIDQNADKKNQYLEDIRKFILTIGENNQMKIQRYGNDPEESVDLNGIRDNTFYNRFLYNYHAISSNWKQANRLTKQEQDLLSLADNELPIAYYHRVAGHILDNPDLYSIKALHTFYIIYLNFFEANQNNLNPPCCCNIL